LHSQGYDRIRQTYPQAAEENQKMLEKEEPAAASA
jgi:hypothetical protein